MLDAFWSRGALLQSTDSTRQTDIATIYSISQCVDAVRTAATATHTIAIAKITEVILQLSIASFIKP